MPMRPKETGVDRLFGALANPTRRDILDTLLAGPRTAGEVASRFDMARPSVSEHLRVLRDAGLVTERRAGRNIHYAVAPEPLLEAQRWLTPYERFWRERAGRLAAVLDELADVAAPVETAEPWVAEPDAVELDAAERDTAEPDIAQPRPAAHDARPTEGDA